MKKNLMLLLVFVGINSSFLSKSTYAQHVNIDQEGERVFLKGNTEIFHNRVMIENKNVRTFNLLTPFLRTVYNEQELKIIDQYTSGVRKNRSEYEIQIIRDYQKRVHQKQNIINAGNEPIFSASGFTDEYAYEYWDIIREPSNVGGSVDTSDPSQLIITGPDDGIEGHISIVIDVVDDGEWIFEWHYDSVDISFFDEGGYLLTNEYTQLAENADSPASGTEQISVTQGDKIGFRVKTVDGKNGPGILTITNFDVVPANEPIASFNKLQEILSLVIVGEEINFTLDVTNTGDDNLEVSDISLPAQISYTVSLPLIIEPGASETITFIFSPQVQELDYSENITITHNASGSPFEFTVNANVLDENVFVTEFSNLELVSGEFTQITAGGNAGSLSQIYPDFNIDQSVDETVARDLTLLVTSTPDINSDVLLQIGGTINFNADQWLNWNEGTLGTRVFTPVNFTTAFLTDATTFWIGHGFEDEDDEELEPSGIWSGRIAFYDTEQLEEQQFVNNRISEEGWYFFSSPKVYTTIDELLDGLWTQCFEGAKFIDTSFCENPTGDEYTRSNVLLFDPEKQDPDTEDDGYWIVPESADQLIAPGTSIAVYVYETQEPLGSGSPTDFNNFDIELNGFPFVNPVTITVPDDKFKFIGNPFNFEINLQGLTESDYNNIDFIYSLNDTADDYDVYDITEPSGELIIKPFEGFFVHSDGVNSSITLSPELELSSPKQQPPLADAFIQLNFVNEYVSAKTSFRILDDAGPHRPGAPYLAAPGRPHIRLFSHHDDDLMMLRYLPSDLPEEQSIPISIESRYNGTVTLNPEITEGVPADWNFILIDKLTGKQHNLRSAVSSEIEIKETDGSEQRFELLVIPYSDETSGDGIPSDFALNQNYPNPFNPATVIQYDLPESADVRLDVYSIEGRLIASLVNETQQAGQHQVTFQGDNLASGIYIYRLQAGSYVSTKRMTLVK